MVFLFEYHIFLHHSQTIIIHFAYCKAFEYHIFLHHSQTIVRLFQQHFSFEYHIFLHHSQTYKYQKIVVEGLNTIYFYIILKR